MHSGHGLHFVYALPSCVRHHHDHRVFPLHFFQRNRLVQLHAGTQAGHIHDAQIAVHEDVGNAAARLNAERGRAHQANLSLAAPLEPILAQILQRVFAIQRQRTGRGHAVGVHVAVLLPCANAVQQNLQILIPLRLRFIPRIFDDAFNCLPRLLSLLIVRDVESLQLAQLTQTTDPLRELVRRPVGQR